MAKDRGVEHRPQEEEKFAQEPDRISPEDFYPSMINPMAEIQEIVKPLGTHIVRLLETANEAVTTGGLRKFELTVIQDDPSVTLHAIIEGNGAGPFVRASAEGIIYGEIVKIGGIIITTPGSGIFYSKRVDDDPEPIVKEGVECKNPRQILGYLQSGKGHNRRPIRLTSEQQKEVQEGFIISSFEVSDGQRVTKSEKEATPLCRISKIRQTQ